jgi:pantoate--beta-alanine ligase
MDAAVDEAGAAPDPLPMIVIRQASELRAAILQRRKAGDSVGFVPTMGFLHGGQISLVERAREENGCVVVSSFVNPSDFRMLDEATRTPRDTDHDLALLERAQADIAFLPDVATMFAPDDRTRVTVEGLTRQLEGASRPGHLDGLTTVMLKLVNLVGPARMYLGQKHAQQVVILRRLMRDLFMNVDLVVCPTVRANDGLALSSANAQLSIEERHAATCLYAALAAVEEAYDHGERSAEVLRARMTDAIETEPMARLDYSSVADAHTLSELQRVSGPALALLAVWIGRTRLTDNLPLAWDVA